MFSILILKKGEYINIFQNFDLIENSLELVLINSIHAQVHSE